VGLSDHSGTIYASLAAVTLGANLLEVHVAFSRACFGPDVPASVTTSELAQLVSGVRFIEKALAHPLDKQKLAGEMGELKTRPATCPRDTRCSRRIWRSRSRARAFRRRD
jgi:N-acetylneuraminate synthase